MRDIYLFGLHSRYVLFAVLNAGIIVPVVYCFFPETAGMRLEDIDHIFEQGGVTGGVLSRTGRAVDRRNDIEGAVHRAIQPGELESTGSNSPSQVASEVFEHPEKA